MAEINLNPINYITVQGWMRTELDLKNGELLTYALIYGFSQTNNQWCTASQEYIAEWLGMTTRGLRKVLDSLEEKGFIERHHYYDESGGRACKYKALVSYNPNANIHRNLVPEPPEQSSSTTGTKFLNHRNLVPQPPELSSSNTIKNNIDYIIDDSMGDKSPASAPKEKRKAFIKPTLEEVKAYCIERKNNVDPQRFFDYYESNGWKVGKNTMKDWKAAVRTWERNGYSNNAPVKQGTCGDNKPKDFDFFNF